MNLSIATPATTPKRRQLSVGQSASLMLFLKEVEAEPVVSVINAAGERHPICVQLAEFFAKNILLERVVFGEAATSLVVNKGAGRWSDEYKRQKHFLTSFAASSGFVGMEVAACCSALV